MIATEAALEEVRAACRRTRRPLRGKHRIGVRLGKVVGRRKPAKHFILDIRWEQLLDGFSIVRTSLAAAEMDGEEVVRTYKGLSVVERAFRTRKTTELHVRPIHHRLADRVRAPTATSLRPAWGLLPYVGSSGAPRCGYLTLSQSIRRIAAENVGPNLPSFQGDSWTFTT